MDVHEELRQQHEGLNLKTLRLAGLTSSEFDWWDVDLQVVELGLCLERHLTLEEEGGFLRSLREELPADTGLVQRIEDDHRVLRRRLRDLRHALVEQEDRAAVRLGMREWIDVLTAHEGIEHRAVRLLLSKARLDPRGSTPDAARASG